MGVEHFVIAPLPPTDHLQVKIMCISKSMKLITPPFSQTQGSVACGINIQQKMLIQNKCQQMITLHIFVLHFGNKKKDQFYMQEVSARPLG